MTDASQQSSTADYTMGYGDEFQQELERRSAETNAAHLIPHLEPGMRVLDFGCGPGRISIGLAKAVEPGELHGIDMEESQVELARAAATVGGHDNATFHVGDVTDLPFEDESFDVAHCHALLNHVPETQTVLAEVKRVLKPGGIVSAREWISEAIIWFPFKKQLNIRAALTGGAIEANNGHPFMGKELKNEFIRAGYGDVVASVSCDSYSSSEDIEFFHGYVRGLFGAQLADETLKLGIGTQEDIDGLLSSLDEWKDHPGAFAATLWGVAIGRKP